MHKFYIYLYFLCIIINSVYISMKLLTFVWISCISLWILYIIAWVCINSKNLLDIYMDFDFCYIGYICIYLHAFRPDLHGFCEYLYEFCLYLSLYLLIKRK